MAEGFITHGAQGTGAAARAAEEPDLRVAGRSGCSGDGRESALPGALCLQHVLAGARAQSPCSRGREAARVQLYAWGLGK